jgi:hypothetical protein
VIEASTPGPWAVDNTLPHHWAIINTKTGRRKVIGPVSRPRQKSKVNYFDRAYEEATRRNTALAASKGETK